MLCSMCTTANIVLTTYYLQVGWHVKYFKREFEALSQTRPRCPICSHEMSGVRSQAELEKSTHRIYNSGCPIAAAHVHEGSSENPSIGYKRCPYSRAVIFCFWVFGFVCPSQRTNSRITSITPIPLCAL